MPSVVGVLVQPKLSNLLPSIPISASQIIHPNHILCDYLNNGVPPALLGTEAPNWFVPSRPHSHLLLNKPPDNIIKDPPDSIPIAEFMSNEAYGRYPLSKSRNPFTCGLTGRTYSTAQVLDRSECLARALAHRLKWTPNDGTAWDKVVGIFSLNTVRRDDPLLHVEA